MPNSFAKWLDYVTVPLSRCNTVITLVICKIVFHVYFFLKEREHVCQEGEERERERDKRERIPSGLRTVSSEPSERLEPTDREIMS